MVCRASFRSLSLIWQCSCSFFPPPSPLRAALGESLYFVPLAIKMLMKKWLPRPQFHFQSILDVTAKGKCSVFQFWSTVKPMNKIARFQVTSGTNGPPCRETHQAHTNQSSNILQRSQNRQMVKTLKYDNPDYKIKFDKSK